MNGYIFNFMKISAKAILLTSVLLFACTSLMAQAEKDIVVSYKGPYTDHIALGQDSRDTDIILKLRYDQALNTLTASIISYRTLFVFRDRTRYGAVTNFFGRVIPEKFPYVVNAEDGTRFKFSRELKKSIREKRSKHIFNNWIEYTGLQPRATEYNMVNDYIEQVFEILPGSAQTSLTLRDIYLLEDGEILCGKDLQTRYNITLEKDPCFGKEEELAEAGTTLENLLQNYNTLKATANGGEADSQESADLFLGLKEAVVAQFPRKDIRSECPAVQNIWDRYNEVVDSLSVLKSVYTPVKKGVNVQVIFINIRELDENVSKWLLTDDPIEKRDLAAQNEEIIKDMENLVAVSGLADETQVNAYAMFRKAVAYSRQNIK